MKKFFLMIVCLLLLFAGCGKNSRNDNGLSKFAKTKLDSAAKIEQYMESQGLSEGFDQQKRVFVRTVSSPSSSPDSSLLIQTLAEFASFIESKTTKGTSTSTLAFSDLKFVVTHKLDKKNDSMSSEFTLSHNDNIVYHELENDDSEKVKTNLSVEQLLELLNSNGMKIDIAAYAADSSLKKAVLILHIPQKEK